MAVPDAPSELSRLKIARERRGDGYTSSVNITAPIYFSELSRLSGGNTSGSGVSYHAYELWDEVIPLKERIESIFDIPVVVDNNVRALALAEKEARNDHEGIVFIKYGPGIGASLVFDETIYRGATYNALEFGHTIVTETKTLCSCGKTGCLENQFPLLPRPS